MIILFTLEKTNFLIKQVSTFWFFPRSTKGIVSRVHAIRRRRDRVFHAYITVTHMSLTPTWISTRRFQGPGSAYIVEPRDRIYVFVSGQRSERKRRSGARLKKFIFWPSSPMWFCTRMAIWLRVCALFFLLVLLIELVRHLRFFKYSMPIFHCKFS